MEVSSDVRLFATLWVIQSMKFSRPEHWSGEPFPSPGDFPNPGIKPRSPALQTHSLSDELHGKPGSSCVCLLLLLTSGELDVLYISAFDCFCNKHQLYFIIRSNKNKLCQISKQCE